MLRRFFSEQTIFFASRASHPLSARTARVTSHLSPYFYIAEIPGHRCCLQAADERDDEEEEEDESDVEVNDYNLSCWSICNIPKHETRQGVGSTCT